MQKFEFIANKGDLLTEIKSNCAFLSYNDIKMAMRKKDVLVNGLRQKQTVFLNGGENVVIYYNQKKSTPVPIIYEDENIIIVNKPANMECTIKDKTYLNKPCLEEIFTPFIAVHRLDMNTSGLMIMAKNETVKNEFISLFKNNCVSKKYYAVTYGIPPKQSDILQSYANKINGFVKVFDENKRDSVSIKTGYEVLQTNGNLSLLDITLFTGYTHQIRAHLSSIHCFILGDDKYGKKEINNSYNIHRQQLCSYSLLFNITKPSFLSYLTGKQFSIPLPFDLNSYTTKQ